MKRGLLRQSIEPTSQLFPIIILQNIWTYLYIY